LKYIEIFFYQIVAPLHPLGPWFEYTWICIISESFHVYMNFSDSILLEKKIFKRSHPIIAFLWFL
jgi:hypothetical protein